MRISVSRRRSSRELHAPPGVGQQRGVREEDGGARHQQVGDVAAVATGVHLGEQVVGQRVLHPVGGRVVVLVEEQVTDGQQARLRRGVAGHVEVHAVGQAQGRQVEHVLVGGAVDRFPSRVELAEVATVDRVLRLGVDPVEAGPGVGEVALLAREHEREGVAVDAPGQRRQAAPAVRQQLTVPTAERGEVADGNPERGGHVPVGHQVLAVMSQPGVPLQDLGNGCRRCGVLRCRGFSAPRLRRRQDQHPREDESGEGHRVPGGTQSGRHRAPPGRDRVTRNSLDRTSAPDSR